jgi:hypothetical protein
MTMEAVVYYGRVDMRVGQIHRADCQRPASRRPIARHQLPLSGIPEAYRLMQSGEALRVVPVPAGYDYGATLTR